MPRRMPQPRPNEFPTIADVVDVTDAMDETATPAVDAYDASRALSALWKLCCADLAQVYIPAGRHNTPPGTPRMWNIWLELTRRRVELRAWVREWLASQEPPDDEGSAA